MANAAYDTLDDLMCRSRQIVVALKVVGLWDEVL